MKILLTNDDGINSVGLTKLENILKKYGEVYVVAPSVEQSGKACSINTFKGLCLTKIDENHIAVDGSPVDCVEVACSMYPFKFDLVVSGCNAGYNLANDIMYSGTCGACIQSLFSNIPSIAFSTKGKDYFDVIDNNANTILNYIFNNNILSNKYFLNVNIPIVDIKGIKITKIQELVHEVYEPKLIDDKTNKYVIYRKEIDKIVDEDEDRYNVVNGYISITPLSQNLFKKDYFDEVVDKIK